MVFEAINENLDLKVKLLGQIRSQHSGDPWFLTNTSSIPIHELDEKAALGGRIIGFHFYNPPAVQKLVELIRADSTLPDLADFAAQFAKKLRKTVVPAQDVAGFIGNGHFMRDALYAVSEVERLAGEFGVAESIYMVNKVSQDFLIRPMGVFQLVDYVGLDVCQSILRVMNGRLAGGHLQSSLIDRLVEMGITGGQFADGSQKDGIFKYGKGRPEGVYRSRQKGLYPFAGYLASRRRAARRPTPAAKPWKIVIQTPDRTAYLDGYFRELAAMKTLGAALARSYGLKSKEIGLGLVKNGVAEREEDVNTVLLTGFFHAYGPVNRYFDGEDKP